MEKLNFFTTEHCQLCESAKQELLTLQLYSKIPFEINFCDVIDREDWYQQYHQQIPVIVNQRSGRLLHYPFDISGLLTLLKE